MGLEWLTTLLSGNIGGLFTGVGTLAKDIRTAVTGKEPLDQNQAAELALKAQAMELAITQLSVQYDQAQMEAQAKINLIDAASNSPVQRNWRPMLGWVCVLGFAYSVFLRPVLPWLVAVCGGTVAPLPAVDMAEATTLLAGMLGLGTMRTVEKLQKLKG